MKRERLINLDLIRILSIFLVIIIHIVAPIVVNSDVEMNYSYIIMIILDGIARCSVPLFVMLSGSLLLGDNRNVSYKKLYLSKILKLLTSLIFFSLFYSIVDKLFMGQNITFETIRDSVETMLSGSQESHLWFIYMIVGLYLILPILKKMIKFLGKREISYYFIMTIIFSSLIPMFLSFTKFKNYQAFTKFDLGFFNIYITYFLLGYYLNNLKLKDNDKRIISIAGITGLFITIIITLFFCNRRGEFCHIFFEYYSINVIIYSVFAFVYLKDLFGKIKFSDNLKNILTKVSKLTFGIYLIHSFIIKLFTIYYNTFINEVLELFPLIGTIIFAIFIFLISLFVSYILSKIPGVNKYLIYYEPKREKRKSGGKMILLIKLGLLFLNFIYFFIKLLPIKNRITFISRQSNRKSDDIVLLENEIRKRDKNIEVVTLCKTLDEGFFNKVKYFIHMFVQMYYLSTSKVIILDGYCICASVLKKKKNTVIIQMWHALGAFKRFGLSIVDSDEGSSKKIAKVMKMHNNYDYVLTSSENTKKYFSEAFGYNINKVKVMPLPRVDNLTSEKYKKNIKKRIEKEYPILKKKKNIIYVPTFRKDGENIEYINNLIDKIDYSNYNLIVKLHPLSKIDISDKRVIIDKKFTSVEMMIVSDYVITDYSAIVFEAAILEKPIFFYCYDYDKYYKKRNFYIDYKKEMPGSIEKDADKIIKSIENEKFDLNRVTNFRKKYIDLEEGKCSSNLVDFIFKVM